MQPKISGFDTFRDVFYVVKHNGKYKILKESDTFAFKGTFEECKHFIENGTRN